MTKGGIWVCDDPRVLPDCKLTRWPPPCTPAGLIAAPTRCVGLLKSSWPHCNPNSHSIAKSHFICPVEFRTRTVTRAFHDAQLTPQDVTDVLLPLLPDVTRTLIMDRTFSGRTDAHEDACPHVALWLDPAEHPRLGRPTRGRGDSPRLVGPAPSRQQLYGSSPHSAGRPPAESASGPPVGCCDRGSGVRGARVVLVSALETHSALYPHPGEHQYLRRTGARPVHDASTRRGAHPVREDVGVWGAGCMWSSPCPPRGTG